MTYKSPSGLFLWTRSNFGVVKKAVRVEVERKYFGYIAKTFALNFLNYVD